MKQEEAKNEGAATKQNANSTPNSKRKRKRKRSKNRSLSNGNGLDINGAKKSTEPVPVPGNSCNPLSSSFSAVDYLKHRTPLYQVNTINIDDMYSRKGELSTVCICALFDSE